MTDFPQSFSSLLQSEYQHLQHDQILNRLEQNPEELTQFINALSRDSAWMEAEQNVPLERAIIQISLANEELENTTLLKILELTENSKVFKELFNEEILKTPVLINRCLEVLHVSGTWSMEHKISIKNLIQDIIKINDLERKSYGLGDRKLTNFRQLIPQLALCQETEDLTTFKELLQSQLELELVFLMIEQGILDTEQARSDPKLLEKALWTTLEVVQLFYKHGIRHQADGLKELEQAISNHGIKKRKESEEVALFLAANGAQLKPEARYSSYHSYYGDQIKEDELKQKLRPLIAVSQKNATLAQDQPLDVSNPKALGQWLLYHQEIASWIQEHPHTIPDILTVLSEDPSYLDEIPCFLRRAHLDAPEHLALLAQMAIENNRLELLQMLSNNKLLPHTLSSASLSPLKLALKKNALAAAHLLIDQRSPLGDFTEQELNEIWIHLCTSSDPLSEPLMTKLLETAIPFHRAQEEITGNSALIMALKHKKHAVAVKMMEKQAHTPLINQPNQHNETPLSLAIEGDQKNLIHMLLNDGADPALLAPDLLARAQNYLATQKENKAPQETVKKLSTTRNFANFIADGFIRGMKDENGISLEGNPFTASLQYFNALNDALKEEIEHADTETVRTILGIDMQQKKAALNEFTQQMGRCGQIAEECRNIRASAPDNQKKQVQELSYRISHSIRTLKPGDSLAIPSGWSDDKGGHAMLCVIRCVQAGRYECLSINTGDGAEHHAFIPGPNKRYINPVCTYRNLFSEEVSDPAFIQALLEPLTLSSKKDYQYGPADLYEGIFRRFKDRLAPLDPACTQYITGQRAGSCSIRVLLAYMQFVIGEETYKTAAHFLKRIALTGALAQAEQSKQRLQVEILKKGTENFCRNTLSLSKQRAAIDKTSDTLSLQEFQKMATDERLDVAHLPQTLPEAKLTALAQRLSSKVQLSDAKDSLLDPKEVVRSLLLALKIFQLTKSIPVIDSSTHPDFTPPAQLPTNTFVLKETLETVATSVRQTAELRPTQLEKEGAQPPPLKYCLQSLENATPELLLLALQEAEQYCSLHSKGTKAEKEATIELYTRIMASLPLSRTVSGEDLQRARQQAEQDLKELSILEKLPPEDREKTIEAYAKSLVDKPDSPFAKNAWERMSQEECSKALKALHSLSKTLLYAMLVSPIAFPDRIIALYKAQAIAFTLACRFEELQFPDKKRKLKHLALPVAPLKQLEDDPYNILYNRETRNALNTLLDYYRHTFPSSENASLTLFDYLQWGKDSTIQLPIPASAADRDYLAEWMEKISDWSKIDATHSSSLENAKINQDDWRFAHLWLGKHELLPEYFAVTRDLSLFITLMTALSSYEWPEYCDYADKPELFSWHKRSIGRSYETANLKIDSNWSFYSSEGYIPKGPEPQIAYLNNSYSNTHFHLGKKEKVEALVSKLSQNAFLAQVPKEFEPFFATTVNSELTAHHLRIWMSQHLNHFLKKENQTFATLALFRSKLFVKELTTNPALGKLYLQLIDRAVAETDLMIKESRRANQSESSSDKATQELVLGQLFFYQLRIRILASMQDAAPSSSEEIAIKREVSKTRQKLEKLETLNVPRIQRAVQLTYVASFAAFPSIGPIEAKKIVEALWLAQFYSETTVSSVRRNRLTEAPSYAQYADDTEPSIEHEAKQVFFKHAAVFNTEELFHTVLIPTMHTICSELYGISLNEGITWTLDFPKMRCLDNGHEYEADLSTYELQRDKIVLNDLKAVYEDPIYKHALGNQRFKSSIVTGLAEGKLLYEVFDKTGAAIRFYLPKMGTQGAELHIERDVDGISHAYVPWKNMPRFPHFPPLPKQPNPEHYVLWCSSADGSLRVIDRETQQLFCQVSKEGRLTFSQGMAYAWLTVEQTPEIQALQQFDQAKNILALENSSNNMINIQYCCYQDPAGNPIAFNRTVSNGPFVWEYDPQLFIAKNQKLAGLPNYTNFLVLENTKGQQKALVPLKTFSTCQTPNFEGPPYNFECESISLDKNGRLDPKTTKQCIFATYLALTQRNYLLASEYLNQAYSLKRYSADELKYMGWLIHSGLETDDHDPDTYAIRNYAAWLVSSNLFRNPSSEAAKAKSGTLIEINTLYQPSSDWEAYFEGHGHWLIQPKGGESAPPLSSAKYMAKEYSEYLRLRKNVTAELRIDSSASGRSAKIKLTDEILWIQQLLSEQIQPQLTERFCRITQSKPFNYTPYPPMPAPKQPEFAIHSLDSVKGGPLGEKTVKTTAEATDLIDKIFPRTRPDKPFQAHFKDFYFIACEGTPTEQKKLLHLLNDMRHEKNPLNQGLRAILEAILLKHRLAKSMRELIDSRTLAHSYEYGQKEAFEQLQKAVETYIQESDAAEEAPYKKEVTKKIAKVKAFTLPLTQPPTAPPPSEDQLALEIPQERRANYLEKDAIGKEQIIKSTTPQPHKLFPKATPKSVYAQKRHEQLLNDYQEGCKKNDRKIHYQFRDGADFASWKQQLEVNADQEEKNLAALLEETLALAKKSAPTEAMSPDDSRSHLKKHGKQHPEVTFATLLAAFGQESRAEYRKLNPLLTNTEITALHNQLGTWITLSLDAQRNKSKIALLETVIQQMQERADPHAVEEHLQSLGELCDYSDLPEVHHSPALLLFQYLMDKTIRADQVEDIKSLLGVTSLTERYQLKAIPNLFKQKIMGGGKTLVIGTLLALLKADGYHLSILIPPSSLFDTNAMDAQIRSDKLFGQKTYTILFKRDTTHFSVPYLSNCYQTLISAIANRESIILPPESLQAMENKYWEVRKELNTLYKAQADYASLKAPSPAEWQQLESINSRISILQQSNSILKEILKLINTRAVFTFDEVDSILETLKEMNFPVGAPNTVSNGSNELIAELYAIAATDPEVKAKGLDLLHNQSLNKEKFEEVKTVLAQKIFSRLTQAKKWRQQLFLDAYEGLEKEKIFNQLYDYLSSLDTPAPDFIAKLHTSRDPLEVEAAELLTLCRQELNDWLLESWQKSAGVHYGFSRLHAHKHFAIPFLANNKPNEKSEFADPYKSINTTLQLYLSQGLKEEQTARLVEILQRKVRQEWAQNGYPPDITKMPTYALFQRITGLDILAVDRKQKQILHSVQALLRSGKEEGIQLMFEFLIDHVLPQIKIYPEQISHNAQTLASMPLVKQGYSGSMENADTFPDDVKVSLDHGTSGQILDVLLRENYRVHAIKKGTVTDHLKQVLGWPEVTHPHAKQLYGMVDLGPIYKGESSEQQARDILTFIQTHPDQALHKIKGALYWDDISNRLCCIKWKENEPMILRATDPASITAVTGLKPTELFAFYPHHKLTGADLTLPTDAYLLGTFSEDTPLRDLEQGVMRARGIFKHQHIEMLVLESTHQAISKQADAPLIEDLVIHAEEVETDRQEAVLAFSYIQKIANHAREYVKQVAYSAQSEAAENTIFEQGQHLLLRQQGGSLFEQYGGRHGQVATETFFMNKANQSLVPLGKYPLREIVTAEGVLTEKAAELPLQLQQAYMHTHKTIQDALTKLPQTLLNPESFDWGRVATVEVQTQTEFYTEQQRETEYLVDLETFQQNKPDFKPHGEKPWQSAFVEEIKTNGLTISPYPLSQASHPPIWLLTDVLAAHPRLQKYAVCFGDGLYVTENFVRTLENSTNLFDEKQKSVYDLLAVYDPQGVPAWKLHILSIQEAGFFKQQQADKALPSNMRLIDPEGIAMGSDVLSITRMSKEAQAKLQQALIPVLFLSGNVKSLNATQWFEHFKKWAQDHKREKRELFEAIILEDGTTGQEQQDHYRSSRVETVLNDLPLSLHPSEKKTEPEKLTLALIAVGNRRPSTSLTFLRGAIEETDLSIPENITAVLKTCAGIMIKSGSITEKKQAKQYLFMALSECENLTHNKLIEPARALLDLKGINDPEIVDTVGNIVLNLIEHDQIELAAEIALTQSPSFKFAFREFFENSKNSQALSRIRRNTLRLIHAFAKKGCKPQAESLVEAFKEATKGHEEKQLRNTLSDYIAAYPGQSQGLESLTRFIYEEIDREETSRIWWSSDKDKIEHMIVKIQALYLCYEETFPALAEMGTEWLQKIEEEIRKTRLGNSLIYKSNEVEQLLRTRSPMAINLARKLIRECFSSKDWEKVSIEQQKHWLKLRREAAKLGEDVKTRRNVP